jgi:hypothetical protein
MTTSYYLVGVTTGHVLAQNTGDQQSSGVVLENKGEHDDEQKWTVEFGDRPDVVALKCVANGKYMNAPESSGQASVGLGEKQWWWISNESITPRGACHFHPLSSSYRRFLGTSNTAVAKGRSLRAYLDKWTASLSMVYFYGLSLTS